MNQIINGLRHGPWELYYDNGKLWYKCEYVNGKYHGPWEWYWSNGKLHSKGSYV